MAQLKIVHRFELSDGQAAMNVAYCDTEDGYSAAQGLEYATAVETYWDTVFDSFFNLLTQLISVLIYEWVTGEGWVLADEFPINAPGVDTGQQLPAGVAMLVQQGVTGSSRRGRKFIPPMSEDQYTGQNYVGGALTAGLGYVSLMTDTATYDGVLWIWGLFEGAVGSGTFRRFSGTLIANSEASYQRRRRQGVGI